MAYPGLRAATIQLQQNEVVVLLSQQTNFQ